MQKSIFIGKNIKSSDIFALTLSRDRAKNLVCLTVAFQRSTGIVLMASIAGNVMILNILLIIH